MRILSFILLLTLVISCKKALLPEQQAVDAARTAFKEDASKSNAGILIKAMDAYISTNGYKDSTSAKFVLEAARISSDYQHPVLTRKLYRTYLVEYPDRAGQADLLAEYIRLSEKLKREELNEVLYKSFANRFPEDERTASFNGKIQDQQIQADSLVRHIGLTMFNDSTFRLDIPRANLYVELCQDLVMANPGLPEAEEYLHHAAETARTLRNVNKAIELYDWIIDHYPTSDRATTSLFLKAFSLDNDLKQFEKAGEYYKAFLEQYPDNEFTESAQFLLDNLGKSEDELKRMLEENAEKIIQ